MLDLQLTAITSALLEYGKTIPPEELLPTVIPEAAEIVAKDPYAFCIATCLDRGTRAEIIWTIPYDIKKKLGHLDPFLIYKMSLEELEILFKNIPRHPRYVNDAPKTIRDLTRIVVEECNGNAANIWLGKRAADVKRTFISIHGVGPGISSMGVLLIEKAFGIRFSDLDRTRMDIKPDTHTVLVLYRLGASEDKTIESALAVTWRMNPSFPGELDGALWDIGRKWCYANDPNCEDCPVSSVCPKIGVIPTIQNVRDTTTPSFNQNNDRLPLMNRVGAMKKIVLISCVSQKLPYRSKAKDLYISSLFKKSLAYARKLKPDAIYVLSAKYGLLDLEAVVDPYNFTLNTVTAAENRGWARYVAQQLSKVADLKRDHFIFLAGNNYRKNLLPLISSYEIPMEGLTIGRQLQALSR